MINLKLYIIHDDRLKERDSNIKELQSLSEQYMQEDNTKKITIDIINHHPPSSINVANIKNLVKLEVLPESENQLYNQFLRKMSVESLSNTFNHVKALQTIAKDNDENTYHLILEDDIVYSDKIYSQLFVLLNNLQGLEWDLLFLGQPKENENSFEKDSNKLQLNQMSTDNLILHCCESYMVKASTARELISEIFPLRFFYNVQLSYLLDKNKNRFKCAKIFPNICGDGSKTGKFNSAILPNNVLIFNQLYKQIYVVLENSNSSLSEEVIKDIKEKLELNPHKDNPDFIYLEALFYRKQGDLEKCKHLFQIAMEKYESLNVPINNTSTFLRNYIELFRFDQEK